MHPFRWFEKPPRKIEGFWYRHSPAACRWKAPNNLIASFLCKRRWTGVKDESCSGTTMQALIVEQRCQVGPQHGSPGQCFTIPLIPRTLAEEGKGHATSAVHFRAFEPRSLSLGSIWLGHWACAATRECTRQTNVPDRMAYEEYSRTGTKGMWGEKACHHATLRAIRVRWGKELPTLWSELVVLLLSSSCSQTLRKWPVCVY